jgi:CHASE2 domain-containing sensor protein/signal transduction histidine kinase
MNPARRWTRRLGQRLGEWTLALPLAALAFVLAASGWTWRADRLVYDVGLAAWRRPPPPGIVIVAIDDASVDAIGRWPWPRAVHSTLLERLAAAGPRAIGLDLILSEPDPDPAQDTLLASVLRRAGPVVMPVAWQAGGAGLLPRVLTPVPELARLVTLGAAEPTVDDDGVLRHAFLRTGRGDQVYPHMALALLQAGGEVLDHGFPVERDTALAAADGNAADSTEWLRHDRFLIRYAGPPGQVQRVSYLDLLRGAVPTEVLRGNYVLVGMTALGLGDTLATPVNRQQHAMPGVEVLANTLYTLRSGDTLHALGPWPAALLSAVLLLALVASFERIGTRAALVLALASVPVALALSLLALGAGWWWSPLPYVLSAALAYPFWSWRRLEQAVDSLDLEIRRLEPEGGLQPVPAPRARPSAGVRDRLASRLHTLHAATDTVRSARRFLADALSGMPTAMLVTDESGRVLLANALAATLFEVDGADRMTGLDLPGLLEEFQTAQPVDWAGLLSADGAPSGGLAVEAQLARLGDFLLHFACVILLGQQRWVVTFADVTAIKQAQRRRDETLAFVTHDLRSPASSIMLLADLHLQGRMQMPQHELLAEVQRLAARTLQLADDIVRVAHAESRPLQLAPVTVPALLDEVVSDFRPQALTAGVTLLAQLPADLAPWLADRALVLRALGNLVSNAVKHSPRGGQVALGARWHQGELVLAVSDTGPGLSAEQRLKLHHDSQGLPAGDARGVGLGLLFVQRVAARHRGRLVAHPGPEGLGTVFELQLGALPDAPAT